MSVRTKSSASTMPLSELMSAPITADDMDFDLDPDAQYTMSEFEAAWKNFMTVNPDMIPQGKRETHIKEMQKQVKNIRNTRQEAQEELHKQLDFFEKSRKDLETDFEKELDITRSKQKSNHESLQRKLDSVAIAEHLLSQVIPWEHFLASVDKAADKARIEEKAIWKNDAGNHKAKPSKRAMFLVDGSRGNDNDVILRAYQIDHALLNTQVKMLQKEAEGYEKLMETQKSIGKLLNDTNVWSMVTKPPGMASTFLAATE